MPHSPLQGLCSKPPSVSWHPRRASQRAAEHKYMFDLSWANLSASPKATRSAKCGAYVVTLCCALSPLEGSLEQCRAIRSIEQVILTQFVSFCLGWPMQGAPPFGRQSAAEFNAAWSLRRVSESSTPGDPSFDMHQCSDLTFLCAGQTWEAEKKRLLC